MIKNLVLFIFITGIWALVSCSSGKDDKYSLLDDKDKAEINNFCDCFAPVNELVKRWDAATDSIQARMIMDTIDIKMENIKPCLEKVKYIKTKSEKNSDYEKQVTAYIKENNAECYEVITGQRKTPIKNHLQK